MLVEGNLYYSDVAPQPAVLAELLERNDQQIMGLEMLAAFFGLSTFARTLKGSCIHLWIDNTAGESALRKGASKCRDHNLIAHNLRLYAAQIGFGLEIHRVPSKLNISDLPSREDYKGLEAHGATHVKPIHPNLPTDWVQSFNPTSKPLAMPSNQKRSSTQRRQQLRQRADGRHKPGQGDPKCKPLLGLYI